MINRRVICRYIGNDTNGIVIDNITIPLGKTVEFSANENLYSQILDLFNDGEIELFEYASTKMIDALQSQIDNIMEIIGGNKKIL